MKIFIKLGTPVWTLLVLIATFTANSTLAVETTAAVEGLVVDNTMTRISGAKITVTNDGTGFSKEVISAADGYYTVRNLPVTSTYTVEAIRSGYANTTLNNVRLDLGKTKSLQLTMGSIEEVVVVAEQTATVKAIGPSVSFSLQQLQDSPAVNRNINDIIQQDPRVYVNQADGDTDSIQCNGSAPRYNSLTVDGVRLNDSFGLNTNGYPTERMPFPYDAISGVSVELAPFSVVYGGFSACNINAVTKSGGNEWQGSFFSDFGSDSLRGDSLEGSDLITQEWDEQRYGFDIGGAIIEDTLFVYAAYEKYDGVNLFERGPIGSGAVNEVPILQSEIDEIARIARDRYNYDPGVLPAVEDVEDEKYLLKTDWLLSDSQRLSAQYMWNDAYNFTESDGDLNELEFAPHLYKRGAELKATTVTLYSDWSDNFSTEIRYSLTDIDFLQEPTAGKSIGELTIELDDRVINGIELDDIDVYLGGDDSRQANDIDWELNQLVIRGTYVMGNHLITVGYERDSLEMYNLFYQHVDTEIDFAPTSDLTAIEAFEAGLADDIYYGNAITNNEFDTAVKWSYDVNTLYIEDEFKATDLLTMTFVLRYERYASDDRPNENAEFVADYGFSNSTNLDGLDILLPRFGFTYEATAALTLRGGIGLYSGGNPNVWYSNAYSGTNTVAFQFRERNPGVVYDLEYTACEPDVPVCGPGWGVPVDLYEAATTGEGSNFEIVYLDPEFELPSEWKYSLGATFETQNGYLIDADLLVSSGQDWAVVKHGDLERTGTSAQGYPTYDDVRTPSFVTTNVDEGREALQASLSVFKAFDNGINLTIGYAYTDSKDVSSMTSATHFSNYIKRAFFDPEENTMSRSNYEVTHRFTAIVNYTADFFNSGYDTRISLFMQRNSGQPYSLTLSGAAGTIGAYGFTPYLDFEENVLPIGGERNSEDGSTFTKADLSITQELPGFMDGHKGQAFITIDNITNLLNDDWGVMRQAPFFYTVEEDDQIKEFRIGDASLYEIRIGLSYQF